MTDYAEFDQPSPPSPVALPLPLYQPLFTYILLGAIIIIWVLMQLAGRTWQLEIMAAFANYGPAILQGEIWRLLTSMFLHANLQHIFFNAYSLYILGMGMERLYGSGRFLVVYMLAGLFGSLLSFAGRGPAVLSVGASGAIFGLIGMQLAFFLIHHRTFGSSGRAQIMNTLLVIGFNLFLGFTIPGIDNLAHIGGLVAGFALGYGLTPRYEVVDRYSLTPYIVDTVSLSNRWWVPTLGAIILVGGVWAARLFWGGV